MTRRLTIALMALVVIAIAAPGVVPIGMKAEWDAYWRGAMEQYGARLTELDGAYTFPLVVDTMTIPQGRLQDTFDLAEQAIWYPFIFSDDEAEGIIVNCYRIWNSTTVVPFTPPDSTPWVYPGAIGEKLILKKAAADTGSATGVTIIGFNRPPVTQPR